MSIQPRYICYLLSRLEIESCITVEVDSKNDMVIPLLLAHPSPGRTTGYASRVLGTIGLSMIRRDPELLYLRLSLDDVNSH